MFHSAFLDPDYSFGLLLTQSTEGKIHENPWGKYVWEIWVAEPVRPLSLQHGGEFWLLAGMVWVLNAYNFWRLWMVIVTAILSPFIFHMEIIYSHDNYQWVYTN